MDEIKEKHKKEAYDIIELEVSDDNAKSKNKSQ